MRASALAFAVAFVLVAVDRLTGEGDPFNGVDVLAWVAAFCGVLFYALAESVALERDL